MSATCEPVTIVFVESAPVAVDFDGQPTADVTFAGVAIPGPPGPASAYVFPPPDSSDSPGTRGQWSYQMGYMFQCVATDSWVQWPATRF